VPTYQYTCTDCGEPVEALQKFSDSPLTVCAACGGRLRKVFSPVGIVCKGSGFYRTDSRNSSGARADGKDKSASESSSSTSSSTTGSDSSSSNGSADKPAAKSGDAASTAAKSSSGEKVA